tara:strand:+ start:248 stop:1000 length:753 start_codon:yes stop_codon:yes gene_type:complete
MSKQYFFLDGMPRAGHTLLSTILNQNPDVQTTANSLVMGLLHKIHSSKSIELFTNFPDHKSLDNVVKGIIPNYYKDWNYKYIIDRSNVGLGDSLTLLKKYLKNPLKIIVLTRELKDVISSFLKAHKNWKFPVKDQVQHLLRVDGKIHRSVLSIKKLKKQEYKDITHFITYEDLVNNPEKTINDIYEFLEIPQYNHYFTNLNKFSANGITYNEDWYLPSKVTIDLHDIRTENISFIKHEKLPENILKLCTR